MRRDPREMIETPEEERRVATRAWAIVLGAWIVGLVILALVVTPLLFSVCARIAG
jgi:hypothetical protein